MTKTLKVEKQKRFQARGKITAYPRREFEDLYKLGKINGYDVAKLVTDAIEMALEEAKETLSTPASPDQTV